MARMTKLRPAGPGAPAEAGQPWGGEDGFKAFQENIADSEARLGPEATGSWHARVGAASSIDNQARNPRAAV